MNKQTRPADEIFLIVFSLIDGLYNQIVPEPVRCECVLY